jgi:predicted RNA-binding Zn ribbon-like protein
MLPQRPLRGEPMALDLVNTTWREGGRPMDLLATPAGTRSWLGEAGLAQAGAPLDRVRKALIQTRAAMRCVLEEPTDPEARSALNAVLAKGRVREQLGPRGPEEAPEVPSDWHAGWMVARNYLHLLRTAPDRLRRCAHPDCVLYFLDTTKNGTRRWCSMQTCGNRWKAMRHYRQKLRALAR